MAATFARLLADARPDADLLADPAGFAELVRRYGPLVRGVCRRTLGDPHLADDAFQATFLVLARKATTVRPDAVASFLHSTATFTALRVRTAAQRRRRREMPTHPLPERADEPTEYDAETLAVLADEVARLPAKLRTAVLVCELDETPRSVAAVRLGIPEGTLSSRLAAARKTLAERLRRRGVTAPLTALAIVGVADATASPTSTALAEEVLRAMTIAELKPLIAVTFLLVAALGFVAVAVPADEKPAGPPPAAVPSINRILVLKDSELSLLDPAGEAAATSVGKGFLFANLSPQADRMTVWEIALDGKPPPTEGLPPMRTIVRRLDGIGAPMVLPKMDPASAEFPGAVRWSADGKRLLVGEAMSPRGPDGHAEKYGHWDYDPATGAKTEIKLPPGHYAVDWTADGKQLLTQVVLPTADGGRVFRIAVVSRATGKADYLVPETPPAHPGRFSPDGKRVLFVSAEPDQEKAGSGLQLYAMTLATRDVKRLTDPTDFWNTIISMAWSPDGKRVAYTRKKFYGGKGDAAAANAQVVVCDADGANPKVIAARTLMGEPTVHSNGYTVLDWR